MAEKIPQHVHCNLCWKAIPVDEKFCSDECKCKVDISRSRRGINRAGPNIPDVHR